MSKEFKKDLIDLAVRLKNKEKFAFTRFSDGELYILQNKKIFIKNKKCFLRGKEHDGYWGDEELKSFIPEENQSLRNHLKESFTHKQKNYFKGICCKCCVGEEDWNWQFESLLDKSEDHLTWSNLLINGNYINFMQQVLPAMKEYKVVYVCNKMANLDKLPLNLVKDFRVGQNCHVNDIHLVKEMKEWVQENNIKDHLFLFSAASLSNLLIYELYKQFPNNTYMDIGMNITLKSVFGNEKECLPSNRNNKRYWQRIKKYLYI